MSTAETADEVVVVDRGRIVQRGPHAELVRDPDGSVYAGLHALLGGPAGPSRETGTHSATRAEQVGHSSVRTGLNHRIPCHR